MDDADRAMLAKALRTGNVGRRLVAVGQLASEAGENEDLLFEALGDSNGLVRKLAAGTLVEADPQRPVEPMLARLRPAAGIQSDLEAPPSFEEIGRFGLTRLQSVPVAAIAAVELQSPDLTTRRIAAMAVAVTAALRVEALLPTLLAGLDDPDAHVRTELVRALAGYPASPEIDAALRARLDDPDRRVRKAAKKAMRGRGLSNG